MLVCGSTIVGVVLQRMNLAEGFGMLRRRKNGRHWVIQ
jgi:hypothetical protein